MSIVVFGSDGQLGRALREVIPKAIFYNHLQVDITDAVRVAGVISAHNPSVVINAAAYTDVDGAQTHHKLAYSVNAVGSLNIAIACAKAGAAYIYISTDYVFNGRSQLAYAPDSNTHPLNEYGVTKLAGEEFAATTSDHYIVRTSWVYGDGNNFVRTMLRLGKDHTEIAVVNDQWGVPTYTLDLALFCKFLVDKRPRNGIYHFCASGDPITWAEFARTIFSLSDINCTVKEVSTDEFYEGRDMSTIAERPKRSILDCSYADEITNGRRGWYTCIKEYLEQP